MKRKILFLLLLLSFSILSNQIVKAEDSSGAKALFYSGEGTTISHTPSKPATVKKNSSTEQASSTSQKYMGIAYWIDKLSNDGQVYRASASSTFRGGDRIKLYVQTNREGYLYVYNIGTSGMTNLLFPTQNTQTNYVRAYQQISIPESGFIKFDYNPGSEKVLIMLSPNPINIGSPKPPTSTAYSPSPPSYPPSSYSPSSPGYNDRYPSGSAQYADSRLDSNYVPDDKALNDAVSKIAIGSKDLSVEESMPLECAGGRDMVVESGAPLTRSMPATYVVAPSSAFEGGRLISLEIKLNHK